jgi:hypothetical protein
MNTLIRRLPFGISESIFTHWTPEDIEPRQYDLSLFSESVSHEAHPVAVFPSHPFPLWQKGALLSIILLMQNGSVDANKPNAGLHVYFSFTLASANRTLNARPLDRIGLSLIGSRANVVRSEQTTNQTLETWFNVRADRWEREAGIHSSPSARLIQKDYISIMAKGKDVAPFIFKRLQQSRKDWCWALERIFDPENPGEGINNYDGKVKAWLDWREKTHRV